MKHVALILIALAATGSAGAQTLPSGFRLVADVEDDRPARPAFGGWGWSTPQGLVLAGGDALWRVDPQGNEPPTLVLRQVVPAEVQQLGGDLVAWGLGPDDERGLWLTDGSSVRRLAPASFRRIGSVARQGDDFLVKQLSDTFGGELWRLGPGVEPVSLGAGGVFDTGFALLCGGVWAVPGRFLDCGAFGQQFAMRLTDGYGTVEEVGFWAQPDDPQNPIEIADAVWFTVGYQALLASDGTAAGTRFVGGESAGPPFDLWGEIGWVECDDETCGLWAGGGSDPRFVRELPRWSESVTPGPLGGRLYFVQYDSSPQELWAFDGESLELVGTFPGAPAGPLVAEQSPERALMLVRAPGGAGHEVWQVDAGAGTLERVTDASSEFPFYGPVLADPGSGVEPLVPWVDAAGVARAGRVEEGVAVPFDGLDLAGTASSGVRLLGARDREVWFSASTATDGATIWRSDGSSAGTRSIAPTACPRRFADVTPTLVGDLIVDCVRSDGEVAVWFLGAGIPIRVDLTVAAPYSGVGRPPPVVALGRTLIYSGVHQGTYALLARDVGSDAEPRVLVETSCWRLVRAESRVVAECGSVLFGTNGTSAEALLPAPVWSLTEAGGQVVLAGYERSWITDGTLVGTRPVSASLYGLAPAPADAAWTCAWTADALVRLDLPSGKVEVLAQVQAGWSAVPGSSREAQVLVNDYWTSGERHWWRCDGSVGGTREVLVEPRDWIPERLATDGRSVWRYTRASREQIRRLSLSTGAWSRLVDLPAAVEEFPVFNPWDFIDAIVVDGASLWVTLPHPDFGREPWVLDVGPIFADGFESGDLRAWAQDTALSAEQLAR
jgi:hypothetical protein